MANEVEYILSDVEDMSPSSDMDDDRTATDAVLKACEDRIREVEEEVEKLNQLQRDVNTQLNQNGPPSLINQEEIIEVDNRSVYVGNVEYTAIAEELEQHFYGCGAMNRVTIHCNKYDGHPKGYAYIEFADKESAETAMTMDESMFKGRQIKVMPKRTNRPGISTTHRPPRGRGAVRGSRGMGRGFYSPFQWRPIRRPRGYRRGFYVPY